MAKTNYSPMYSKIKVYYENGKRGIKPSWTLKQVWDVVGKAITEAEYEEITGFTYPAME